MSKTVGARSGLPQGPAPSGSDWSKDLDVDNAHVGINGQAHEYCYFELTTGCIFVRTRPRRISPPRRDRQDRDRSLPRHDVLHAPTNLRAHAQRIDGFEEVDFFCATVDACEEPD
jgi:hypothetical protein